MATIDSTLKEIMSLDFNTREMLLEIFQKRQIEARREEIAKKARKTIKEYHSGNLPAQNANSAVEYLEKL